jgi:glutamine---fructose-6-phosphate transaminase (isomerizing)
MSRLAEEIAQVPEVVARALTHDGERFAALGAQLRAAPPRAVATIARGSSDHAAHYIGYLAMARLGCWAVSLPPSLITLHHAPLAAQGVLALAVSQSGRSPDLVEALRTLGGRGAQTMALVNDAHSPLADAAAWCFDVHAGAENSVAASKSFVAQALAGARWVAAWQGDAALTQALQALPVLLQQALVHGSAWVERGIAALVHTERMVIASRGTGLSIAMEIALKLKEVCGIQAEAFSGAELRHGPMALVGAGYPVLVLAPRGPAQAELIALAGELQSRGAQVLLAASPGAAAEASVDASVDTSLLPLASSNADDLNGLLAVAGAYRWVEALARARGRDPDAPPHLAKITRTR